MLFTRFSFSVDFSRCVCVCVRVRVVCVREGGLHLFDEAAVQLCVTIQMCGGQGKPPELILNKITINLLNIFEFLLSKNFFQHFKI